MSTISINNVTDIDSLIRWKIDLDNYIYSIMIMKAKLTSAMGVTENHVVTLAEVQFRFDSKLRELTQEQGVV